MRRPKPASSPVLPRTPRIELSDDDSLPPVDAAAVTPLKEAVGQFAIKEPVGASRAVKHQIGTIPEIEPLFILSLTEAPPAVAPDTLAALPANPTQKELQRAGYQLAKKLEKVWKPHFRDYKRFKAFLDSRAAVVPNVSRGRRRFVHAASLVSLIAILPDPVSGLDMPAERVDAFVREQQERTEAAARIKEEGLRKMQARK